MGAGHTHIIYAAFNFGLALAKSKARQYSSSSSTPLPLPFQLARHCFAVENHVEGVVRRTAMGQAEAWQSAHIHKLSNTYNAQCPAEGKFSIRIPFWVAPHAKFHYDCACVCVCGLFFAVVTKN